MTTEEIQEMLAEFENRISYLENSLPFHSDPEPTPVYKDTEWTNRQWDAVKQLKAQVIHLTTKVNELRAKKVSEY